MGPPHQARKAFLASQRYFGEDPHIPVVRDEDPLFRPRPREVDGIGGAFGIKIDGPDEIPASRAEGVHERSIDIGVDVQPEAAGHYGTRTICPGRARASSASSLAKISSISSRLS